MGGAHRASEPVGPAEPSEHEEEGTGSRWVILALLSASLLIIAMDTTVLNVALPAVVADLHADSVEQLWIIDGYALALSGLLVTAGALGDRTGRRRVLLFGFAIFGLASLAAAVSVAPWQLIAARVALGIGGAAIMPATLSMLRQVFTDPRERTFAFGVWAAVFGAGMALGPLLAGWLLRVYDWHSVFLINVPIAMAAMLLGRWLLPDYRRPVTERWDWAGLVLSILFLAGLATSIKLAGAHGLTDPVAFVALLVAAVALYGFIRNSLRRRHPLLNVRLFAHRGFTASAVAVLLAMFGMVGLMFVVGQWLQYSQGRTPFDAAVHLLPLPLALIVATLGAPLLIGRLPARELLAGSLAVIAVGMAIPWFAGLSGHVPYWTVGFFLALTGLGAGVATTTASLLLMSSSPREQAGAAAAVDEVSYELGGALGVAALGSVAVHVYRSHLPVLHGTPEHVDAAHESVAGAAEASHDLGHAPGTGGPLDGAFGAFEHAFTTTALVAAIVLLVAAAAAWWFVPRGMAAATGEH